MDRNLMYMIGAGILALILIILILRFAVRPKKAAAPATAGLGLPVAPSNAGRSESHAESKPLSTYAPPPGASSRSEAVSGTSGPGVLSRDTAVAVGGAEPRGSQGTGERTFDRNGCPKCGGRFLDGELEGPTLMVDGVSRDEFQPLLTARECSACGYLELYTRPVRT